MKIRNILDNLKTPFEKGQKLEKLYPAFDAFETIMLMRSLIFFAVGFQGK